MRDLCLYVSFSWFRLDQRSPCSGLWWSNFPSTWVNPVYQPMIVSFYPVRGAVTHLAIHYHRHTDSWPESLHSCHACRDYHRTYLARSHNLCPRNRRNSHRDIGLVSGGNPAGSDSPAPDTNKLGWIFLDSSSWEIDKRDEKLKYSETRNTKAWGPFCPPQCHPCPDSNFVAWCRRNSLSPGVRFYPSSNSRVIFKLDLI